MLFNRHEYSERHCSVAVQNTSVGIMSCHTASVVGRMANETETERLRKGHIVLIEVLFQNPAKGTGKKKDISARIVAVPVENLTGYITNAKLDSYHYDNLLSKNPLLNVESKITFIIRLMHSIIQNLEVKIYVV